MLAKAIHRQRTKKFNPSKTSRIQLGMYVLAFGLLGGIIMLVVSRAAVAITIDPTLPVPQNVKAYGDDRNIIVTWDPLNNGQDNRVVGYYVTYRPKGSNEAYKVRQQQVERDWTWNVDYQTSVQLQPLQNGVEYEINVQSVSGTRRTTDNGPLIDFSSTFYVADGKASNKATVSGTPSSARVDDMRNRLTGFFDDFNQPAGPFDELKWNTATTACITPGTAAAFLNDQFHSHNQIRSSCDRAGIASRPRGIFDISGATESNPAVIQFDIDGASQPRDTWYLDIIPLSARPLTKLPVDITSHNDLFDADSEDPGNMVRINARSDTTNYAYYAPNRNPQSLNSTNDTGMPPVSARSPLPVPDIPVLPTPNVRNHWIVEITPTRMRVIINGKLTAVKSLPAAFTSEKKFTLHSTIFSYNTGKQYRQVTPYVQMLHWDNFGFSGPAQEEVIHNYLEGGADGKTPVFSTSNGGGYSIPEKARTTVIPVPDEVGSLKDGKARLFFTMQDLSALSYDPYTWSSAQNIVFNGRSYPFPDPRLNMNNPKQYPPTNFEGIVSGFIPLSVTLNIDQADIVRGNNTVRFNLGNASVLNVHLELPYSASSQNIPSYTQPLQIFGQPYASIIRPPLSTCDQYWFVERDLGLTYGPGSTNLITTNGCLLIDGHNHTQTTTQGPITPPSNSPPTIALSTSTVSTTAPANYSVSATGVDNDGTITKIEISQNGSVVQTCTSSSCTYNASNVAQGTYTYTAVVTDNQGATGTAAQKAVTVTAPTPPPVSNKFTVLAVNAALPSESECASRVKPAIETRPANAVPNATRGVGTNYDNARVTGNYSGTTDEIIQWGACKWGMDEDVLRAQMVQESYWHQSAIGDFSTDANTCSNVYPLANYPAQYNGDTTHNGQCPESYGLSQVRWSYHKSAFFTSTTENDTTRTNNAIYSTAYNVDYWASVWRRCYNGEYTWLNTVERGKDYAAGDQWGCLGMWFSGRWYTDAANGYIANVQSNLNGRVWETTAFKNAQPINTIPGQGATTDTTTPTVSLTAPANNATVSGTVTVSANAADNVGVSRVSYYLDNSSTAFSNDSTAPYTSTWNTATVANGAHTIRATAIDAAGNIGTSSLITVNVQNVVPDTTTPTVSLTAPANNSTVRDTIVATATASDNVGITKVELLIDGQIAGTDTTSPYSFSIYTPTLSEGQHTFRTRAYDAANNNTLSNLVTVTVDNIAAPAPVCQDATANNIGQPLPCTYTTPPPTPSPVKPGDATGDGKVDRNDLRTVLFYYGTSVVANTNGDITGDGKVDRNDLRTVLFYYLK